MQSSNFDRSDRQIWVAAGSAERLYSEVASSLMTRIALIALGNPM